MNKSDFYYDLPPELIAQEPLGQRDKSRLLVMNRKTGATDDRSFYELPELLQEGDCLILNDSRVLPARLYGHRKDTGTPVELLLLRQTGTNTWEALAGPGKRARIGHQLVFGDGLVTAEIIDIVEEGNRIVRFSFDGNFYNLLEQIGNMPLPPYIKKRLEDNERYQTVYSRETGSAAAPTAGLHFTPQLLDTIRSRGVEVGFVTLHVGLGTFRPVKVDNITEHTMHYEHYELPADTADIINRTKARGGRVIAVGTTSCRTLESVGTDENGRVHSADGWTGIFIYPGYEFKVIDGLVTNFHLPESTLIMLVSALAGHSQTMSAYIHAVDEKYRFFSFGDAMAIL